MAFYTHFPGTFPHAGERTYTFSPYSQSHPLNDIFRLVGGGVDHSGPSPHFYAGFPFATRSCRGRGGRHRRGGPRTRRDPPRDPEKADNPEKSHSAEQTEDPPEVAPETESEQPQSHDGPTPSPFDPSTLGGLFDHLREFVEQVSSSTDTDSSSESPDAFTPPLDLFETDAEYVLHLALPGAKKEDVGVDWDAEKGQLRAAGVVHRPGDEEFLKGLRTSERKVGMFERIVKLPPGGEDKKKEEIDGEAIVAKMEDGVLVIRVPKVEKEEWTEIRKIDIE